MDYDALARQYGGSQVPEGGDLDALAKKYGGINLDAPKPLTKRTTGEAFTDVGAGLVSGIGSLVQLPSQLYGLATGDFSDTGLMALGKGIEKQGEGFKSEALKQKEAARAAKIQEAEKLGFWEEFKTGAAETIKDPALLTSFLAEQLPQLLGSGLIGKGVKGAVLGRELAKGVAKDTAETTAITAGVRAGVGTGAVQQGADIGAGTYEETYNELVKRGTPVDQAKAEALGLARASGASGAIISLLAQRLPGAKTLEESFVGAKGTTGRLLGAGKGLLGEAGSEAVEEGGGKFTQNLAMREVDPTTDLMKGVGTAAGMAAIGGGAFGTVGGALKTPARAETKQQETPPEGEPLKTEQGQLLLPRPDEIILNDKEFDPLKNPVGNFTWQELTKDQRAYIDKDRKENGKPRLNTYSLEDVVDAIRHTVNVPKTEDMSDEQHAAENKRVQDGAIDTLLTYKVNFDQAKDTDWKPDTLFKVAELHGVETGTQGWNDYLTRVTGTDDVANMSKPQLYSAISALKQLPEKPAERVILPQGTNAVRFNEKQYADALKGLEFDFGEYGTNALSPTSVIDTIKQYTNLSRDKDAEALYKQALKRGDLEENLVERPTTEGKKFVREVSFAGASEALPGGFDIRDMAFKHGMEPEGYRIQNGSVPYETHKSADEAQKRIEHFTQLAQEHILAREKSIEGLNKGIEKRNRDLDSQRVLGYANTPDFIVKQAEVHDKNLQAQRAIAKAENDIKNLSNPFQIVPFGEKPVVKRKQVLFQENKAVASFEEKTEAEQLGIRNLDVKTLEQIIESAPRTKGTLPKRYASMAEKELARRRGEAPKGIEVPKSFFNDEVQDKADELEKTLRPALKRFGLENVALRIVDSIRNGTADGEWSSQVIAIAMDAKNPMGTLRHESIHALKELGAFTDAEWKVLENKAKGEWVQRFIKDTGLYDKYKEEYKRVNKDSLEGFDAYINEEAIAEAFKYFENFQPPAGMIGNIFYRISQLMQAIRNAFNGAGFNTAEEIFTGIEQGAFKQAETAAAGAAKFQINPNAPRKIGDRIVGAPPNASTEEDRKQLIKRMLNILKHPYSMYNESKDWYERSGASIREISRNDPELMEQIVRLTALYSQANSLGGNITAVIKSVAQIAKGNKDIFAGRFPETTAYIIPSILSAPTMDTSLKGVDDKLMNFYRNLHDATFETDTFQDSSTIDRWMMRLFGYPHTEDQDVGGSSAVSATQYKYAKDLIERITKAQEKKTGEKLHPRQIQSVLWTFVRNNSGFEKAVDKARDDAFGPVKEKDVEFNPDILDFSDYVKRATAHITWETRPSESIPMIQGIHTAPRQQQDAFNRAVQKIFTDANGEDKIFKLLKNEQLYSSQFSIGAYENKIAPNIITKVVLQKDEKGHIIDTAREYAAIVAFVTKQDAVPWYRPDPTASGKFASKGFKVSLDVPVTQELEESLFKHINEKIPGVGFTKVDDSFDFINYRGNDGKPYMMSDRKYIEALENALKTFASDVHFKIDEFRAQSEYFSNNWKEQTNGEGHLSRISPERLSNIQPTLDNWRKEYEAVAQRFGEEYGWNKEAKFSFRSFKPVESTVRPSEGGGRGITLGDKQKDSITVDGVHYGNVKTDELDASKFGTGLRGAERKRLADAFDDRIKKRVYFYIPKPSGEMPTRESGVGSNVYTQTFNNILGQGSEMSRLYSAANGDMNNFESSIIDDGYDGYAIPEMGMMVVLNHNVPVNYEGTIGELSEVGRLEEGRVLPKPVLSEELQNEVKELRGLVSNITLAKIERALADFTDIVVNVKITPEQRKMAEDALAPYYAKAKAIKPIFDSKLKAIADLVGGTVRVGGIKKIGRAAEKLILETASGAEGKPDGKDIVDLLRATIVVPTEDKIPVVIDSINTEFKNIQRIKDRFKNPTPNGYRDVLLNVKLPNQLVAEIQINIPEMITAKHTGHKIYKMSRNLDEGTAKHEQLVNAERALYGEAYLFAQNAKSSESALEAPLRNASVGNEREGFLANTNEPSLSSITGSASTANNVAPSGTLNGDLTTDNSPTERNRRFSIALGSIEPSTFLVSDAHPNNFGDLAFIPKNSRVMSRPIRLAVGTHSGLNDKGFGANHIIERVRKDASRNPPPISKELLEDIILNVENIGKTFTRIYKTDSHPIYGGTTYILYEPRSRESLIVRPRAEYYEVITAYRQDIGSKYGNPIWSGANVQPEAEKKDFGIKQQGISVKAGERGVEPKAVATVFKKSRVITPQGLQERADDIAPSGTRKTLSLNKPSAQFSLRAPDTVPFKRWFGNSKIVNPDGTPKVMYHGTARDISVFKPKQAGAIFLTSNPRFAKTFSETSDTYVVYEKFKELSLDLKEKVMKQALKLAKANGVINPDNAKYAMQTALTDGNLSKYGIDWHLRKFMEPYLDTGENIMPFFVRAEKPFDYSLYDKDGLDALLNKNPKVRDKYKDEVSTGILSMIADGSWEQIEKPNIQNRLKDLGFDSFYVMEGGQKNLAVYDPSQIKSATGNLGTYDINNPDIRFSLRSPDTVPFKRWFGNSKVVDAQGKPLVVYHGTADDFDVFELNAEGASGIGAKEDGFFFTPDVDLASGFSRLATKKGGTKFDTFGNSNVMPVYLSIKNPKVLQREDVMSEKRDQWVHDPAKIRAQIAKARKEGYDGLLLKDYLEDFNVEGEYYIKRGDQWVAFEPSQIKSATGNIGAYDVNNPDIRYSLSGSALPSDVEESGRKDNMTFLLQDKQIDLKRIIENIRKYGKDVADKWNAYLQEELYHGRSAARVKYFIDRELNPILKKMSNADISLEQMDDYLHARHAKEANAYLRTINKDPNANSGKSDKDADDYMNSLTAPRKRVLENIAKEVDAITKQTRQMMVDYGIESQKTIDQMEKTYKHYVPLFREETEGGSISTGRGFNIRGSTTRQRTGSSRKVVDVFANIALQRERTIARGEKNRVGNSLLGLILQSPDKNFWSAIRPDEMSQDMLESELLAMGLDPDVARNLSAKPKERILNTNTGEYEFKTNPLWLQQPNIFITRVNGEDRIMAFNQNNERSARMAVVFNNLDSNQKAQAISMMGTAGEYVDKTMKGVGTATRYFAAINTQYNPAFSIFNFLRDVGGATLNLQSTALKGKEREVIGNSLTALKEIYKDLRLARDGKQTTSKWGQIFEEFEMEGGKTGFRDIFNTSEDRANALAGELKAFTQGGARTKAKAVFDWLSDFNEAVENSIRVSAYKSALDIGMSKQQAASLAKNLTVNFNRTGAASKNFTMLYAFFNASVQGTARIAETLIKDGKLTPAGKKIVYGGISVGVFQAALLAMGGFEEDEPPEFVKDKNFIIPYGDKKYIAIPLPLGFNMFPAFGRRITEFAMSDDKNVGKAVFDMGSMVIDAFNPLGSATFAQTLAPTLIDPVIALAENKDFSGKPISRDDLNSLNPTPGYTRAKENASAVSTGLAYAINFLSGGTDFKKGAISPTPDQIDYLIGQATGGVGREALKVEKAVTSVASGEELATYNVPVLGRMIGDVKQKTVETSRFYENVKTLNEHQHEIEGRLKAGEDINDYLNSHPEALMYKYADQVYNKVNDMKRIRRTMKEQGMASDDLQIYDENILMMMTVLNESIRDMRATR
jgi:hypothetical protein